MNYLARLFFLVFICSTASFACTSPPAEGINLTWPPGAVVSVLADSNLQVFNEATNAINNWNDANLGFCYAPLLSLGTGPAPSMSFSYGPIANDPITGAPRRGLTTISFSSRITSANSIINWNIPTTFPNVITEVIAHEIGHTMGLNDCNGCVIYSSVIVSGANVPQWTGTAGQPGPLSCDIAVEIGVAFDYICPPSPPPPDDTCPPTDGEIQPVCSPIVLDIGGKGFSLTSAAGGVLFDISGTGHPIQMGWTAPGADNAFLALPGPDGLVQNGKQLFGNFTPQPPSTHPNGFAALAVYDDPKNGGNGNGVIDPGDSIYSKLRLWIDANHDGICQPEELHTLASLGVTSISLHYREDKKTDQYGNQFRYRAPVDPNQPDPENVGRTAYDIFFVTVESQSKTGTSQKCPTSNPSYLKPAASSLFEKSSRLE